MELNLISFRSNHVIYILWKVGDLSSMNSAACDM